MAKLLPKGAAMPIAAGITKIELRLKWDESGDPADPMDVDGVVKGVDASGKIAWLTGLTGHPLEDGGKTPAISGYFIAPGNEFGGVNPFGWIEPAKDERTGAATGWDEVSKIDLSKVPAEVTRLDVQISIYPMKADGATPNGHTMAMINNCSVELANGTDGKAIVQADAAFQNPAMWGITAVWFVSVVRDGAGWKFVNVMASDPSVTYYNDWMDQVAAGIPASNV